MLIVVVVLLVFPIHLHILYNRTRHIDASESTASPTGHVQRAEVELARKYDHESLVLVAIGCASASLSLLYQSLNCSLAFVRLKDVSVTLLYAARRRKCTSSLLGWTKTWWPTEPGEEEGRSDSGGLHWLVQGPRGPRWVA